MAYATAVSVALGVSSRLLSAGGTSALDGLDGGGSRARRRPSALVAPPARLLQDDMLAVLVTLTAGYAGCLRAEELGSSGVIAAMVVGLASAGA